MLSNDCPVTISISSRCCSTPTSLFLGISLTDKSLIYTVSIRRSKLPSLCMPPHDAFSTTTPPVLLCHSCQKHGFQKLPSGPQADAAAAPGTAELPAQNEAALPAQHPCSWDLFPPRAMVLSLILYGSQISTYTLHPLKVSSKVDR